MYKGIVKTMIILFIFLTPQFLFAQKEGWNWYFGDSAAVNFSSGSPVALTNSAMTNFEGVASISDTGGNLLFYTNGLSVYDSSNTIMPNGTGLLGHPSSTQSGSVVKKPGSDSLYYIFTADYQLSDSGFNYSVVDMSLNNGKGDVIVKNIRLNSDVREKVTAIRHSNYKDFWIVVIDWASDDLYAYLLDSTGVSTTPVISPASALQMQMGTDIGQPNHAIGYMKVNRQGNRIAMGLCGSHSFDLFDFDNSTGIASNHMKLEATSQFTNKTYGVEFSPDGSKLYGTTLESPFQLLQFNLNLSTANEIVDSVKIIATTTTGAPYYFSALQLGPDGKIYCSLCNDTVLGVINNPDSTGFACNYVNNGVSLKGRHCKLGLPNFPADYAYPVTSSIEKIINMVDPVIYPNPTRDFLSISLKEYNFKKATFIVFDILGNVILKTNIQTNTSRLDVGSLSPGIYFLQLNVDGSLANRKFVIY